MSELFECFEEYDVQATRREARKMTKGKPIPQIADELEETVPKIEQIYKAAKSLDSSYDEEEILKILMNNK